MNGSWRRPLSATRNCKKCSTSCASRSGALAGEVGAGGQASRARAGTLAEQCLRALAGHQKALHAAHAALAPGVPYRRAAYAEAVAAEVSAQKLRSVSGALREL